MIKKYLIDKSEMIVDRNRLTETGKRKRNLIQVVKVSDLEKEIEKARKEYNELRRFAGKDYPKGKCKNLLKLLEIGD